MISTSRIRSGRALTNCCKLFNLLQKRTRFQKAETHLCLLKDVAGLGKKGDIVLSDLSRARNNLVPQVLAYYLPRFKGKPILPEGWTPPVKDTGDGAVIITPAILEDGYVEAETVNVYSKPVKRGFKEVEEKELKPIISRIESIVAAANGEPILELSKVQISKEDLKIFGSVTSADVIKAFQLKYKIEVPKDCFPENLRLKEVGVHEIILTDGDLTQTFRVMIKAL